MSECIVLSDRKGVSVAATGALLHHLQNSPMGVRRMEGYVKKLLGNCQYRFPAGRVAALESIRGMVLILPQSVLDDHHASLFLPLTVQLVNDPEVSVREKTAEANHCDHAQSGFRAAY